MAAVADLQKRWAWITALRGLLMLLGGLYAVIFPVQAIAILVVAGGALLLIDGVLGLWSLTFGGAKTGNYWFDVVRNALAVIVGVLILLSPIMAAILTATFLVYLIAFQAIVVGVMEIVAVTRARQAYGHIWPVMLSGILYVLFGVALLFAPILGAVIIVTFGGILAIIFSIGLFALAWRLNRNASVGGAH